MKKPALLYLALAGALFLAAVSCGTVAESVGIAARAAGDAGVIDSSVAGAIGNSADSVSRALEEITPEQEYYIGRAVGANILQRYRVLQTQPEKTAYLNRILQALVVNSPNTELYNGYHAIILDSQEINAFATPGGHILVTLALVNTAQSEDALAAVLAHEVAHIQLHHSIRAIKTSRITQALMATGNAAATVAAQGTSLSDLTSIFDESITDIVSTMVNDGYSRDQEFDADAAALSLLAGAGYEPSEMLDMLRALDTALAGQSAGFGKTHPSPRDRITRANTKIASVTRPADTRTARTARFNADR